MDRKVRIQATDRDGSKGEAMNWIWVMNHKELIDKWVVRIGGRYAAAGFGSIEDLKQEAYAYFAEKSEKYDPTRCSPTTFIRWHVLAVNKNDYRKKVREPTSALNRISPKEGSGKPPAEEESNGSARPYSTSAYLGPDGCTVVERLEFDQKMGCLNETEKYVARLLINGYTQTEIADMHDVNQMRISRMIQKMRPKLRRVYADRFGEVSEG